MKRWPLWALAAVLAAALLAVGATAVVSSGDPEPLPTPRPDRTVAAGSVGGGGMMGGSSAGGSSGATPAPDGNESLSLMSGTATYTRRDIIALMRQRPTQAQREAAAAAAGDQAPSRTPRPTDYLGTTPNWANSPLVERTADGRPVSGTGMRKFVDELPGLGPAAANGLGQYLPVAVPDTITFPGSDYYEIAVRQYSERLHSDLPPTRLRGYVQINRGTDGAGRNTVAPAPIHYLGPLIAARRGRPVRIKFVNRLPREFAGRLFLPVDPSVRGAGKGPLSGEETYPQNRAVFYLQGGDAPWISGGSPHQWITPAGEMTPYPRGVSVRNVPDMWFDEDGAVVPAGTPGASNDPGPGATTLYFPNHQSARLLFARDRSLGIDRLNVYAGEVAPYLLADDVERELIAGNDGVPVTQRAVAEDVAAGTIPGAQLPLIIQDKSFVPGADQRLAQDPTWDTVIWGGKGSLWFPHVYMPNQNPYAAGGVNPMGRWNYGPWVRPPWVTLSAGPIANPLAGTSRTQGADAPGTPNPSIVPSAYLDTMLVNGTAYPYAQVGRKAYRFRILNACNDRFLNLQLYYAASNAPDSVDQRGRPTLQTASGEVPMVPAEGTDGGVPDPAAAGPEMIQVGGDGGILPRAAVLRNTPISYTRDEPTGLITGIAGKTLLLGPGESADVIVDFSGVPAGSRVILYNDAPAPAPAPDPRYDYFTGGPDLTATGGAPPTLAGYGPNTRTILQFVVDGPRSRPFDLAALREVLPAAFAATQDPVPIAQPAYDAVYGERFSETAVGFGDATITFTPAGAAAPLTLPVQSRGLQELFDTSYGRANATLGVELPTSQIGMLTAVPFYYSDPATEIVQGSPRSGAPQAGDGTQVWKITHNGVDTHTIDLGRFDAQIVNRVGWDGAVTAADAGELGWNRVVRLEPLQAVILAVRPIVPELPFKLANSTRLLDPTRPRGSTLGFSGIDPLTGNAIDLRNQTADFGWEYTWQSGLLERQDNDMRRPLVFAVAPRRVPALAARRRAAGDVMLTWEATPTGPAATRFILQRARDRFFTEELEVFPVAAAARRFTDTGAAANQTSYYRLRAENDVAYSAWSRIATVEAR